MPRKRKEPQKSKNIFLELKDKTKLKDKKTKNFTFLYFILAFVAMIAINSYLFKSEVKNIPYSEFKELITKGKISDLIIDTDTIQGTLTLDDGKKTKFLTSRVEDPDLVKDLQKNNIKFAGYYENKIFKAIISWVLPFAIIFLIWNLLMRRMGGAPSSVLNFGKSRGKIYGEDEIKITFQDVAGVDEAKEELQEIIEYLRTPQKFMTLGGKIPKGILLVGPPGTGKTLLAKAVAGEAKVPFFSMSGSDFVEMFVGVGASRVRDLFAQAQEKAPCIIFIDELDALGKARGMNPMSSHDEREQTLNQLLSEMDGFDTKAGVIIMAATNRPEILDPALLRAGRFDRHILVDRPDIKGREEILKVHIKGVKLAEEVDLKVVAARTPGFVGADLANLVNESALLAARKGKTSVGMEEFEEAIDRVIAGLEKKTRVMNKKEKEIVAFHETGHALMAEFLETTDPVHKISIIPRGISALGYTLQLPTEDRYLMTEKELRDRLCVLLGGRVAEEIIFGEVSTGAHNDLGRATDIARSMVKEYGMSKKLGYVTFERERKPLFIELGTSFSGVKDYSEETAREIDDEIKMIVEEAREKVRTLLGGKKALLEKVATTLLEKETIEGEELRELISNHSAGHETK
ncbi:MAG TPA: ATP-dependent zinc metalloprotease FtsH [Syntrophorhabdus sp.]|jgi:cell division protease FtsH|nr:ATP-dependent zinc metalloprotease FtsH [Syntrophorhabdus sp.]MDI9558433.1 ATP-dependent zinc metalloprotease FtsH [Pseudomonadota bacterium]OPX95734.1 MAG: ATP-dependent zinc metalloprotease FtsH 4 [Syntrophorhabdus sp. PtaB.Bin027]OQB78491.1 MAG: ATP-dependent zinc metalloprotease FtsH 4 [Deltaproteobacteria bacterium ADurb.Bin135]MBP8744683.1 ATP-dependent zinc metalloprotease FtsH [Syntrophorhabdus sp.]